MISNVTHSPSLPTNLDTITISTNVTDTSGVQSVTLHYRVNLGTWENVTMTLTTGSIYQSSIGSFSEDDTICYYISAIDNSTHHLETIDDNGGSFYTLTIAIAVPELSSDLYPIYIMVSLLIALFSLVVLRRKLV